jgi:hypothetical protein
MQPAIASYYVSTVLFFAPAAVSVSLPTVRETSENLAGRKDARIRICRSFRQQ